MEKGKWRLPRHKSWQPSVRKVTAGAVALAMLATGIGAYAAGDGDHNEGAGGSNVPTSIMWRYKDDGSGSWGPATDPQSVVNAFNAAGVTIKGNGMQAIRDTLERARFKCATGFIARHPNQGDGECRVVGVGAAVYANDKSYDDTIVWSGRQQWETEYNNAIKPHEYNYAGTRPYNTGDPFDDDPSRSVDSIAYSLMPDTSGTDKKNLIIIVLDKYQPAPATYQLNLETQASGFTQAGYTGPVSDKIITKSNTDIRENVTGDSWLTWRGLDGTTNRIKKQWTASNHGSTTVTVNKEDMSANWKYWPLGKYWFDTYAAKQGSMSGDIGHWGENMASESWSVTQITPPVKTLTNAAG